MEQVPEKKVMQPENAADASTGSYATKQEYFYPEAGQTIIASSQQEADEALAKIISQATIKV